MDTREFLNKIGITQPTNPLPDSPRRFPDGAQYRFEVPGIQKPESLEGLIAALDTYEVQVHRVTQTKGIMLLTDREILEMMDLARDARMELFLSVGPRAPYDTSATAQTRKVPGSVTVFVVMTTSPMPWKMLKGPWNWV